MNKVKKIFAVHAAALILFLAPLKSKADLWGADIPLLIQLVTNTAQQLIALKEIIGTGNDTLGLLREVNRGINDSLGVIRTVYPNINPGIYKDWDKVSQALKGIEDVYGVIVPNQNARIQKDTDQTVAEAISLNNSIYKYTQDIDQIGEAIKQYSHAVSPGGAQKLTAESLGVMLTVMNQGLRAQATGLKMQAQTLALENRKDKEMSRHLMDVSNQLGDSLKNQKADYILPRF